MLKDWFVTYPTGTHFYPLDPKVEDIYIEDIAHALSNICRYNGHIPKFYSVAQHSILVANAVAEVNPKLLLWGLLHDAAEAYLGDMIRPLKHTEDMTPFREAEDRLMKAICKRFRLSESQPEIVKTMDDRILLAEKRDLLPACEWKGYSNIEPHPQYIWVSMSPKTAEQYFLDEFYAYFVR